MSGLEAFAVIGVVGVVAQIVSAYRDGESIIDKVKRKRDARRGKPLPRQLKDSVKETPGDIEREQQRGLNKFGPAFERGDAVAIITIQHVAIEIQHKFLEKLRNAYDDETDFTSLINDADMGRNHTIRALIELQQRLLIAAPVENANMLSSWPSRALEANAQGRGGMPTFAPVEERAQQSYPEPHRVEATSSSPRHDQRQHRFNLFHRSRENSQPRQHFQDNYSSRTQSSFGRVYTMPASNGSNTSVSQTPSTQGSPDPQRPAFQSPPLAQNHRETTMQSNEPWHNPWADHVRSSSVSSPVAHGDLSPPMQRAARTSTSHSGSSNNSIPHPNPSNNYLGFCKGAWKLQDGDRKAMVSSRDYTQSAQSNVKILRCSECRFEGHINPDVIWDRIFKFEGMKIRWAFLAKSHVRQKHSQPREMARRCDFTYQCLFCAFSGVQEPALHGAQAYRDHISKKHHGVPLNDVVLYKAGAVDDRICDDREEFDINLYPQQGRKLSELSASLLFA